VIKEILKQDLSNTLIIASIDFTHYETEEIAIKNDKRIMDWLKTWNAETKVQKNLLENIKKIALSISGNTKTAVAMDSPESFYTLVKIMENLGAKDSFLWKRTSSTSILNIKDPLQNTSHLFVTFSEK
jgi:AmmeMemoRadiSam system protein B